METNIKKQDLRIGNYLRCSRYLNHQEALDDLEKDYTYDEEWLTDTVIGICHPHEDFMYWSGLDEEELMNRVDGIPLSDEWLWALGAERNYNTYVYDRFKLIWKEAYKYWYVVDKESLTYLTKVEFVHEWQNFVYAMNSTELELREKIKEKPKQEQA